jgi:lipid II:glycine glycyltransferase (peptidoglycan interpeptide bridge formation enzyme)
MVRKGEKLGVEVIVENDAMTFLMTVHEENMREIGGLAKPQRFFKALPQYFRSGQDYRLYVARLEGEPVAAVLVFFYNRTVEYYTPVVRKEYRNSQALSVAIFRAMCDAAGQGYAWWNWGGTWLSQDGVYRFKSRWGTQNLPYRYFTSVHNPAILKAGHAELLAAYPSFFTVPFSALKV